MGATATAVRIRHDLHTRLLDARAQTDDLFRIVRDKAIYDRPIPERHRVIFYLGHVEAFDWNLLAQRAFGVPAREGDFRCLFCLWHRPGGRWIAERRAKRLAGARGGGEVQPPVA